MAEINADLCSIHNFALFLIEYALRHV